MLIELNELTALDVAEGVRGRIVTSDTMTVAYMELNKGAVVPEHRHYHEQVVNVIQGELELTANGTVVILKPGIVMVLPPNTPHAARAITDAKVIDVFHPVRKDFRDVSFSGYSSSP